MTTIVFGPTKDSFGYNFLRSFIDHVDYYQSVDYLQHNTQRQLYKFEDFGIPVYDIFQFIAGNNFNFLDKNIIVVETLNQFLSIYNRLDKSKKYLILSESYWDTKIFKLDLDYTLITVPWDLIDFQNYLGSRSNLHFHLLDLNFLEKYNPKFDFLCLAGRAKPLRDIFINKLIDQISLDNSLTSYYGQCLGNTDLIDIDLQYDRNNSKEEFENKFYKKILIDNSQHHYNLSYFTKNDLFYLTKFSIIVETEIEHKEYHVTEKTIKCLVLGHPFVVVGTPGYLKFLNDLGFKTYNSIFDESYDNIDNYEERMQQVINTVKKLKNFSFDKDKLAKIHTHNINNLIRLRDTASYKEFIKFFND